MSNNASVQAVIQNLEDAGCDPETVEEFLALDGEGKTGEQLKLLARQRRQLLDRVLGKKSALIAWIISPTN
ncbi:MAG: hypothetical protein ACLSB9_35010 [Hydrogeniiclostridium mannosilyticum]